MQAIRIQYTVKADFAERNKQNIAKVMEELRSSNHPDIHYSAYVLEDGKTFMHFVTFEGENQSSVISNLESFKHFQSEMKASQPEIPPKFDNLALVGSSYDLFG